MKRKYLYYRDLVKSFVIRQLLKPLLYLQAKQGRVIVDYALTDFGHTINYTKLYNEGVIEIMADGRLAQTLVARVRGTDLFEAVDITLANAFVLGNEEQLRMARRCASESVMKAIKRHTVVEIYKECGTTTALINASVRDKMTELYGPLMNALRYDEFSLNLVDLKKIV